ncbi:Na(+)/H(+) exchanger beta-like [Convolutriloba macropyga]|uniref:Na(+)/H(+) exchanger beta-like n=1 Tax=Convolutriloba macropyga TaxID=536237 RepID=UPI003F51B491
MSVKAPFVFIFILFTSLFIFTLAGHRDRFHTNNQVLNLSINDRHGTEMHEPNIKLFTINFSHVKFPFILCTSLFLLGIAKLGFHRANYLSSIFPESCLLIVVGVFLSLLVHWTGAQNDFVFEPRTFFLYLLPPIMLEAAFCLHDRAVWENIGTILVFACIGTVLNTFTIAPVLFLFNDAGVFGPQALFDFPQCLLFSALISAVDPVAVLAIFEEIHVNSSLYFIVFGESLLNDAMTVVLYRMMEVFVVLPHIPASQIFKGFCSFFIVSLGGVLIGLSFGVVTAFLTRFTNHLRVIEPLIVFSGAYFAYLSAECFELSGIISIICCGIVIAQYAFANISRKSHTVVVCCSKLLSSTCDCVIFLFLGMEFTEFVSGLVTGSEAVNVSFVVSSLLLCLLARFAIVTTLSYFLNLSRVRKISKQEQFIMGYGGLRGAVCFSLVKLLSNETVPEKNTMMTATLCIIFFTVFVQGITMKPMVRALKIQMDDQKEATMNEAINSNLIDHIMVGIEEVVGHVGDHRFKDTFDRVDMKYLRVWLQREPQSVDDKLMSLYSDILMKEHRAHMQACRKMRLFSIGSQSLECSLAGHNGTSPNRTNNNNSAMSPALNRRRKSSAPPLEYEQSNKEKVVDVAEQRGLLTKEKLELTLKEATDLLSSADEKPPPEEPVSTMTLESSKGSESKGCSSSGDHKTLVSTPSHEMVAFITRLKRRRSSGASRRLNSPYTIATSPFLSPDSRTSSTAEDVFMANKLLALERNNHLRRHVRLLHNGVTSTGASISPFEDEDRFDDIMTEVYLRRRRAESLHVKNRRCKSAKEQKTMLEEAKDEQKQRVDRRESEQLVTSTSPNFKQSKSVSDANNELEASRPRLKRCNALADLQSVTPTREFKSVIRRPLSSTPHSPRSPQGHRSASSSLKGKRTQFNASFLNEKEFGTSPNLITTSIDENRIFQFPAETMDHIGENGQNGDKNYDNCNKSSNNINYDIEHETNV